MRRSLGAPSAHDLVLAAACGDTTSAPPAANGSAPAAATAAPTYGSWGANIARSDKVAGSSQWVKDPSFGWAEFWPAAQPAATVDGKVIGVPAVIGHRAVTDDGAMFVDDLANAKKARPTIEKYPQLSPAVADAIVGALLGKAEPEAALRDAAETVDGLLGAPVMRTKGGRPMRKVILGAVTLATVAVAAACGGGGDAKTTQTTPLAGGSTAVATGGGKVEITVWHGQVDIAAKAIDAAIAEFNASHPNIVVKSDTGGVTADHLLEKVETALAADSEPDISYLFGSQLAGISSSDKVADLTDVVKDPSWNWSDFWPAAQDAVTVDGKVRAIPALIDDFGVIYNKKLFAEKGLAEPTADWSWDDFRAAAKALTDSGKGQFGANYPIDASEDTAIRFIWMLWQQGGDLLSADNKEATFAGPEGVAALETWRAMAIDDRSIYLDVENAGKSEQLFNAGKIGMFVTGPWELAVVQEAKIDYGAQILPGTNGDHTTMPGPDVWVVYNKSPERAAAAAEFLKWFTGAEQNAKWGLATGSLPIRAETAKQPGFDSFYTTYPGNEVFVANLANAKKAKPRVKALPKIFESVGNAIVATLLGKAKPDEALSSAADETNGFLAAP